MKDRVAVAKAKQRNSELKEKLRVIQDKRKEAQQQLKSFTAEQERLKLHIELARSRQQSLVEDLRSADASIETYTQCLERARSWNVLASDAYHIDQEIAADGTTIGTINGLRLAAPAYAKSWKEINSAFGYVALLVSQLERMITNIAQQSLRYTVHAAGSNSKIGPVKGGASVQSNLFFAEEGFQFFSKRNFNAAIGQLLAHIQDLARILVQLDPTIVLPYNMEEDAKTVAGVSILWVDEATSTTDFTRGMKYLLTNLKHLMAYPAIGLSLN